MAYTIPTSADTPEQAILAVASAVKGEQVTGGDGSVNTALDILADALAGENVEVPMTQQGAILALAQYVDGMVKPEGTITITENGEGIDVAQYATADVSVSGGGVDVGSLVRVQHSDNAPVVGTSYVYGDACYSVGSVAIGDATIFDVTGNEVSIDHVAAGATVSTLPYVASETAAFYVVAYDPDNDNVVTSVESATVEHEFSGTAPDITLAYIVPAVETGKALWVVFPYGT